MKKKDQDEWSLGSSEKYSEKRNREGVVRGRGVFMKNT